MTAKELIQNRRTIRKFLQKPIPAERLRAYIDCARLAPSGANLQPLRYVLVHTPEMVEKLFPLVRWAAYLAPDYNPKEEERPTAFIAVAAELSVRKSGYEADMGAAVENMILAAEEDGIGSCWMGAIDYEKISTLLELSDSQKLLCVVAMGYKDEQPEEVCVAEGDVKYYLKDGTLRVPKRPMDEVLLKEL